MGLFSKKEKKEEFGIPELPELPDMPDHDFSDMNEDFDEEVHELPSFPTTNMGEKFSRNSIKSAISGYDEDDDERDYEMIPKPKRMPEITRRAVPSEKMPQRFMEREVKTKETGPVFIRIDKFEEALKIFRETKEKIDDLEKLLEETRELKEKEEGELSTWETEIQGMKQQIEKVDQDIFSKI